MQNITCDEIAHAVRQGDDVRIYQGGMVFKVEAVSNRQVEHPDKYMSYIQFLELHLNDESDTNWQDSDLLKGKPDTTGSMSLCKDPTDKLDVLEPGEVPPPPIWKAE